VSGAFQADATEGGIKIRRRARLWTVATYKSKTYRFLRLDRALSVIGR
jgi:hypothetical protein